MTQRIFLLFLSLFFLFGAPAETARAFTGSQESSQNATASSPAEETGAAPVITITNIILKRIDQNNVYAADGRIFPRSSETKIITNTQKCKVRAAELVFRNGVLFSVTIN